MTKLENYFSSYEAYHRTKGNKLTHTLGIPLIVFSLFGLLAYVELNEWLNLALVLWLTAAVFYCRLDFKRGLALSVIMLVFYWAARWVPGPVHWFLFAFGWILQGIGHYKYEKKSPAFLTNLTHLFIGPFWIFCGLIAKNS